MGRRAIVLFGLVWLVPVAARADYYFLDGDVMRGSPVGDDLTLGAVALTHGLAILETPAFIHGGLTGTLITDELPAAGTFGRGTPPPSPTSPRVSPDENLSTHLLHFERPAGVDGDYRFSATIVFNAEIVAILWTSAGLDRTDRPLIGAAFLQTTEDFRRLELRSTDGDEITRGSDGVSVKLELRVGPSDPIDQLRVITRGDPVLAAVRIDCERQIVTLGGTSVTFEARVVNDGPDESLPLGLSISWNPPRVGTPGGDLSLDGSPRLCDGMTPLTCGLGRVSVGDHTIASVVSGGPGETIGVDAVLIGAGTTSEVCHLEGTIPADADPDAGAGRDAGGAPPSPPEDVLPTFTGGGGCVCEVGSRAPVPWAFLALLGLSLTWRCRR